MKKIILLGFLFFNAILFIGCDFEKSNLSQQIGNETSVQSSAENVLLNNNIIDTTCYDYPDNISGKNGIPISCSKNSDCDLSDKNVMARMKEFCSPAEVGIVDCGFRDFCGKDGFCKHDCSINR